MHQSQQPFHFSKTKRSFSLPPHGCHLHCLLHTQLFRWQLKFHCLQSSLHIFMLFPPPLNICIRNASSYLYVLIQWSVICILFKIRRPQTRTRHRVTRMNTFSNISIWAINGTLISITTLGYSWSGSNSNKRVLNSPEQEPHL